MGSRKNRLNSTHQSGPQRQAAPVRVPVGTVVSVTSLFRLEAKISHSAPHVEAPTPEHTHEAPDLEKDPDPDTGNHLPDRSRYNRRRAGIPMVSLPVTDLKPAPSAPRFAAAGLTLVLTRGGSIDAANVGSCPLCSTRLKHRGGPGNIVHRHVTEVWHSWH